MLFHRTAYSAEWQSGTAEGSLGVLDPDWWSIVTSKPHYATASFDQNGSKIPNLFHTHPKLPVTDPERKQTRVVFLYQRDGSGRTYNAATFLFLMFVGTDSHHTVDIFITFIAWDWFWWSRNRLLLHFRCISAYCHRIGLFLKKKLTPETDFFHRTAL